MIENKEEVYREASGLFDRMLEATGHEVTKGGGCLYWAIAGAAVFAERGVRAVLQAGTMSWPFLDPKLDDGKRDTHFTYQWDAEEAMFQMALGNFPEIHVWLVVPASMEVVDFTVGYLPEHAEKTAGIRWSGERPPKFLWARGTLPRQVVYRAQASAIEYASFAAKNLLLATRDRELGKRLLSGLRFGATGKR